MFSLLLAIGFHCVEDNDVGLNPEAVHLILVCNFRADSISL